MTESDYISIGQTSHCDPKCCICPRGSVSHLDFCPAGAGNVGTVCRRDHGMTYDAGRIQLDKCWIQDQYAAGRYEGQADEIEGSPRSTASLSEESSPFRKGYSDGRYAAVEKLHA